MPGVYNETNLIDGVTANGSYMDGSDFFSIHGEYVLGFYGDLGGATVEIRFYTEKPDGTFDALPASADWTFNAKPGAERFKFSRTLPFSIEVTGATGSTNFGLNVHHLD